MKRTCTGCRALQVLNRGARCDLGYKNEGREFSGVIVSAKPLEECPKPRTVDDYMTLKVRCGD